MLYLFNSPGMNIHLRENGFSYEVYEIEYIQDEEKLQKLKASLPEEMPEDKSIQQKIDHLATQNKIRTHRVDIDLAGVNPDVELIPYKPSNDYTNYYTIGTPEGGITYVHRYEQVVYQNIYPGIDLEFVAENNRIKYNFIVHPGGNPNDIQLV